MSSSFLFLAFNISFYYRQSKKSSLLFFVYWVTYYVHALQFNLIYLVQNNIFSYIDKKSVSRRAYIF